MNTRDPAFAPSELVDVQGSADTRHIAINKVGIKAIRLPVKIAARPETGKAAGTEVAQATVATFSMSVGLPQERKGTHMSRFVQILSAHEEAVSPQSFRKMLVDMVQKLEATSGYIEMKFPYFINKAAPVSGVKSLMDYEVSFIGEIHDGVTSFKMQVLAPVTSLCPCSKEISAYGAHNQRSHVTVSAEFSDVVWIEELVELIEAQASCELYGLLKRPDEKYVTERAYDNPKFVEDLVRDVAAALDADKRVLAYTLEAENFESIHNHSAYAVIERDKRKS
ncbi:MAG TPA: GTP cyclohydrolase FolE2 [Burkholderiales bacterium]|nr:GTP cyclohydrolase FolE2 [Burkholderiales bacterium]